jgi:uncharacterized membrane protein YbhN (UPF0104 family)
MNRRVTGRTLAAAAFVVVALFFAGMLLTGQWASLNEVLEATRHYEWSLDPGLLGLAILVGIANLFLMAGVWAGLFRRMGGSAGRRQAVRVWVVTNFGRYIPGKVWQLGGLAVYMKGRGDSGAGALVSALTFQIVALVTGTAVAVSTIGTRWLTGGESLWPGLALLAVVLFVGLHPRTIRWAARRIASWLGEGEVSAVVSGGDVARAAGGMLVAWVAYGVGFLLVLRGVGVPWESVELNILTGIFAASYVVGYLVLVAPGGLVVREGAMTALLAEAGGLAVGVAAAVAIIARLWVVITELGALAMVLAWPRFRREREETIA